MKHFYKIIALLLILCSIPILTVSATSVEPVSSKPSIDVSYSDFTSNFTYYKNLSKNHGYIIYIDCTENDFTSLQDYISQNASGADELVESENTRGIYIPTAYWNVATQGAREINGSSAKATLYSSKLFYGATSYEIVIQNLDPTNLLFQGFEGLEFTCSVAPGKTAYLYLDTKSADKEDAFYLAFYAPCYAYGYVGAA